MRRIVGIAAAAGFVAALGVAGLAEEAAVTKEEILRRHVARLAAAERTEWRNEEAARYVEAWHEAVAAGRPPREPAIPAVARERYADHVKRYEELSESLRRAEHWEEGAKEKHPKAAATLALARYHLSKGEAAPLRRVTDLLQDAIPDICRLDFPPVPARTECPHRIHFDFDKSFIRADAEGTMAEVARVLDREPNARLRVDGHTDWIGTDAYNQGLSERRAQAARDYLQSRFGVDPNRMTLRGHSEHAPIAPNQTPDGKDDPAGRQMNRRVEFCIVR
jgi:outer membrane protein OmpA-like peptidoglycan-associated protein